MGKREGFEGAGVTGEGRGRDRKRTQRTRGGNFGKGREGGVDSEPFFFFFFFHALSFFFFFFSFSCGFFPFDIDFFHFKLLVKKGSGKKMTTIEDNNRRFFEADS